MTEKKESGVFNVTITLPAKMRKVYEELKSNKRLAISSFTVNKLCLDFPEVAQALEQKGGGE